MAITNYFGKVLKASEWSRTNYWTSSAPETMIIYGTAQHEGFVLGNARYTVYGGAGDDQYYGVSNMHRIVELAGPEGGIDTVWTSGNYNMAANIENALVGGMAKAIVGNASDNYIKGDARFQQIDGGAGNDVLTGGGGGDRFEFNRGSGYDIITDFKTGPSGSLSVEPDTVRLAGYTNFTSFAQVKGAMVQSGADVVLTLASDAAIKFQNTRVEAFTADNFLLAFKNPGLTATFSEEFNSLSLWDGNASGTWRTDYGWGNNRNAPLARTLASNGERQLYVDTAMTGANNATVNIDPFRVNDGYVTIRADRTPAGMQNTLYGYEFTSGMLSTRNSFTQTYGYFEARMQLPAVKGAWPAFWLYTTGANGSELDIMESRGTDYTTVNTHDYSTGSNQNPGTWIFQPELDNGFHTYGVLWTPETVTWYLDGVAVRSIPTPGDMHGPMYMIVNLALDSSVGADFQSAEMKVDYVRAYSLDSWTQAVAAGQATPKHWEFNGTAANDRFTIITSNDIVRESANGGYDVVIAKADYVLPANVEELQLQDLARNGTGNELNNRIEGNALDNVLIGLDGNDTLIGGYGADRMIGGRGNDTYSVDNVRDVVIELAGEGYDHVMSSIDYVLPANVEQLTLTGSARKGVGNELNNTLIGNALANHLAGGDGDDWLDGKEGADTMSGGNGNDSYVVDNVKDVVVEQANGGTWDVVYASVDYILPRFVEKMVLQGNAIRGSSNAVGGIITGNALNNILTGGSARDVLDGMDGNDTLLGMGGDDTLNGGNGNDILDGGDGNDVLTGGAGADTMTGGRGADRFVFGDISHTGNSIATADRILDFNRAEGDRIDLSGIDANTLVSGNQAFSWLGAGAFTGVAGQLRMTNVGNSYTITGDVNGDKAADFMILVNSVGNQPMQAADFVL